jgi:hypothetical protein
MEWRCGEGRVGWGEEKTGRRGEGEMQGMLQGQGWEQQARGWEWDWEQQVRVPVLALQGRVPLAWVESVVGWG